MDAVRAHSSLAARLQLWLAAAYLVAATAIVVLVNVRDRRLALDEARRDAHLLLERNLAIHRFLSRELRPSVFAAMPEPDASPFDERWMSSTYAVRRIDAFAHEDGTATRDFYYKESAINARSPGNEADAFEREFIEDARRDPSLEVRVTERVIAGRAYLEVLHRGDTMEASCLRCHSDPAAAPPGLVERYGNVRSFGRPVGQLVSAVAVRVPLDRAYAAANAFSLRLSLALVGVLAALYAVQLLFQSRLVFAPIARLRAEAARLSGRPQAFAALELPPHPELRDLTAAFNRMGAAVARHREELERTVEERTEALVAASRELERTTREREHARKIEALGRLAGGVAHDFNNLLTAVHGYTSLLLESLPEGDPRREDVLEIERAGSRASALTRQLLAFSRRDVVTPRVLDPNRVVEELDGMLRRLIREDVRLELDLAPGAGPVRADPGQLEQIVVNLAVNARDAMPAGGRMVVRTRNVAIPGPEAPPDPLPEGRWLMLSVEDSGVGMDPETLANAFEPFFTTKREAGTGLGLATVQAVVRQCGGAVVAESALGRGSVFRVWLPAVEGVPEAREPARGRPASPAPPGAAVLVAEDDVLVRRLVCTVLRQAGYEVHEATEGAEALAFLDRPGAPALDLLVTDLVMPGMDGHELAVRARERRPGLGILFITGYATDEDLRDRVGTSGEACLQKPFDGAVLLAAVQPLVEATRARRPWR
jgi:signal transduction histidine kinase/ActR/RegA family two-component response regulator